MRLDVRAQRDAVAGDDPLNAGDIGLEPVQKDRDGGCVESVAVSGAGGEVS